MVCVNGLMTCGFKSLSGAWNHIAWMYRVASQKFTVEKRKFLLKSGLRMASNMAILKRMLVFINNIFKCYK